MAADQVQWSTDLMCKLRRSLSRCRQTLEFCHSPNRLAKFAVSLLKFLVTLGQFRGRLFYPVLKLLTLGLSFLRHQADPADHSVKAPRQETKFIRSPRGCFRKQIPRFCHRHRK